MGQGTSTDQPKYSKEQLERYQYCHNFLTENYRNKAEETKRTEAKKIDEKKVFSDERLGWSYEKPVYIHNFISEVVTKVHAWPDRMNRPQYNHIIAVYAQTLLQGRKLLELTAEKLLEGNLENLSDEQISSIIPEGKKIRNIKKFKEDRCSLTENELNSIKETLKPLLLNSVIKGKFKYIEEQENKFFTYDDYKTMQFLALMHDMVEDKHLTIEQLERIAKSGGKENKYMLRAIKLLSYLDKNNYTDKLGNFTLTEDKISKSINEVAEYYRDINFNYSHREGYKYDIAKLDYAEIVQYKAGYCTEMLEKMLAENLPEKNIFITTKVKLFDMDNNKSIYRNPESTPKGRTNIVKYEICSQALEGFLEKLELCKSYKFEFSPNPHFYGYSTNVGGYGYHKKLKDYGKGDGNFTDKIAFARQQTNPENNGRV